MKVKEPDLSAQIGEVKLKTPIMSASGTSGYGSELSAFMDLKQIGAIVVKSLAPYPWDGNPYPRVSFAPGGMLNCVGLQGPGIESWIKNYLPGLKSVGARIVASIWGKSIEEFEQASRLLEPVKADLAALELNISCPNVKDGYKMFCYSAQKTAEVVQRTDVGIPQWIKLSPNVPEITEIALAAFSSGAKAVTLVNSMPGMRIDAGLGRPYLSAITGGFTGPALKPVALKAVFECHAAEPAMPIIGVGGIRTGSDVAEYLMAGASAVQVGTATFLKPRALKHITKDFKKWCIKNKTARAGDLIGKAHNKNLNTHNKKPDTHNKNTDGSGSNAAS